MLNAVADPPKKTSQLLVRLSEEDHLALKQLGASTGIKPATLATIGIQALISYADAHGGRISLPLDFSRRFDEADRLRVAEDPPKYGKG